MIVTALVAGLAALWVWVVVNDEDGLFGWVTRLAGKTRWAAKWLGCPWCSGAWLAIVFSAVLFNTSLAAAVVTALAAASITGMLGSYLKGD